MKLASYVTDGKPSFGAVSGGGVITLNDRLSARYATLRDALAAGALDEIRRAAQSLRPDRKLSASCRRSRIRKKSSASASTTSPTPPSRGMKHPSCRTSLRASSTRW
jgi:hypothetical protein